MMKVTDLDKFCLEEIWRPYWSMVYPEGIPRRSPMSLEQTAQKLCEDSDWSKCVLDRLSKLKLHFPDYVQHPLVDVVKDLAVPINDPEAQKLDAHWDHVDGSRGMLGRLK